MMIDLHCHILPGLDDGARALDEALEMARIAVGEGIETIVATPHLFRGNDLKDFGDIDERRKELNGALVGQNIQLEIKLGAEVHVSHFLIDALQKSRNRLVLNGSSYMFVEFPQDHVYRAAQNLFFEVMNEGIIPIIAHPERNIVFGQNPGLLYDLVQQGALVQVNSGSLTGIYGRQPYEAVLRLIGWDLVHFIASDGHDPRSIPPRLAEAAKKAEVLAGKETARALVRDNPQAVLEDREVPYLPVSKDPRKSRKSFSIRIPRIFKNLGKN